MRRADSLEKTLMLGNIEGRRIQWDSWVASPAQWTWIWASSRKWWKTGKPGVLQTMGLQRFGHDWATEKQQFCHSFPQEACLYPLYLDLGGMGLLWLIKYSENDAWQLLDPGLEPMATFIFCLLEYLLLEPSCHAVRKSICSHQPWTLIKLQTM